MNAAPGAFEPTEVSWPLVLQPLSAARPVPVTLAWSCYDPLAVRLEFPSVGVCWVAARELFAAGLIGPAGLGDVALLPDLDDPDWLELILSSPDGLVGLRLPVADLAAFLSVTWEQRPPSAEGAASRAAGHDLER